MESVTLATEPHHHAVAFCESERDTVAVIARHVDEGLAAGEPVLVVALESHLALLDAALTTSEREVTQARDDGRLVTLDAASTLATFLVDGSPDPVAFQDRIGGVVDATRGDAANVRVFGEMVSILWDDDNVAGALELEAFWNDLAVSRDFTLLCAYASTILEADALADIEDVCGLHSTVIAPEKYDDLRTEAPRAHGNVQWSEVFLPIPEATSAVRRYVSSVLSSWGSRHLAGDAALVATELTHRADVPFRVCLERSARGLRLAIAETGHGDAGIADVASLPEQSIAVVAGLADRWGCDLEPDRKVQWAEFITSPDLAGFVDERV